MKEQDKNGPQIPSLSWARDYLTSFDLFPNNPQEAGRYLDESLRRLLLTLDMVPPNGEGALLEVGAGPYCLTLLLRRFRRYQLELANYFGDDFPVDNEIHVASHRHDERHCLRFRNFNAERDRFPYPDNHFAQVLCCEVLEHLLQDPTHLLCEVHRVLEPGGKLLLTTPNVFNLANALRLLRGKGNIYHPYSCHGPYGRHQREYTPQEVTDLLGGVGYDIDRVRLEDIYAYPPHWRLAKRLRPAWRDNLFVLARKIGDGQRYYPPWLYRGGQKGIHITIARRPGD